MTRYVFWTFNKSFLLTLQETINTLPLPTLNRCADLLQENFVPYDTNITELVDEEVQWCLVKNRHLKQDPKFSQMYELDKNNRTTLLQSLLQKIASYRTEENELANTPPETTIIEVSATSFSDVLKPINNNSQETLEFIISKTEEANFEYKLFSKIDKLPNGKIPTVKWRHCSYD